MFRKGGRVGWIAVTVVVLLCCGAAYLHGFLPRLFADRPVAFSREAQNLLKTVKFGIDLITVVTGFVAFLFDFTSASEISGRKRFTVAGYVVVSLIIVIGLLNLEIATASDVAGQRIAQDDATANAEKLNSALADQARRLAAQLTPTLEAQKQLVTSTTTALQKNLAGAAQGIKSTVEISARQNTQTLEQVAGLLEYANVPLKNFDVRLLVPSLGSQSTSGLPSLSEQDKLADVAFRAALDAQCPPSVMESSPSGLSFPRNDPCKARRLDHLYWAYTRPIEHYLDPLGHLQIRIWIYFPDLFVAVENDPCGIAPDTTRCFRREISGRFANRSYSMLPDKILELDFAASQLVWHTDEETDRVFADPGVYGRDLEFPKLSAMVCDEDWKKESRSATLLHLKSFPASSPFEVVAGGNPTKDAMDTLHLQHKILSQSYKFHLREVVPSGPNCLNVSYAY